MLRKSQTLLSVEEAPTSGLTAVQAQGDNALTSTVPASWLRAGAFPRMAVLGLALNQLVGTVPTPEPNCGLCGTKASAPRLQEMHRHLRPLPLALTAPSLLCSMTDDEWPCLGCELSETGAHAALCYATCDTAGRAGASFTCLRHAPATSSMASVGLAVMRPCGTSAQRPCQSSCHLMQGTGKAHASSMQRSKWCSAHLAQNGLQCSLPEHQGCTGAKARQGMQVRCVPARQTIGTSSYKGQVVLVPQREGFGLCGTVPDSLFVDAWSEAYGRKADLLLPNHDDIFSNVSRINAYSMSVAQAAPLPICPGPHRALCALTLVSEFFHRVSLRAAISLIRRNEARISWTATAR